MQLAGRTNCRFLVKTKITHLAVTGGRAPDRSMHIISIDDRDAVSRQRLDQTGMFVGNISDRSHEFLVLALRVVDDSDGRPGDLRQFRRFTRMIHANLDHTHAMRRAQRQQRQRQADVVVEIAACCQHGLVAVMRTQARRDHFLDCGLAVGTGHRNQWNMKLAAPVRSKCTQRDSGVFYRSDRQRGRTHMSALDQRGNSARSRSLRDKIMAVILFAAQCNKQIAGFQRAAVGADIRKPHIAAAQFAAEHGRGLTQSHHRTLPAKTARTTAASL